MKRREYLAAIAGLTASSFGGCGRRQTQHAGAAKSSAAQTFAPTLALSMRGLSKALAKGQSTAKWSQLGGLNRLMGLSVESDGDILLLGSHEPSWPRLRSDDLAVALRSAFRAGPEYQAAPGISIDPREGESDPWRIQQVKVMGLPADSEMAARFIAVDYELKKASLGLLVLKPGLPNLMENFSDPVAVCATSSQEERGSHKTHRFWFCPLLADAGRYMRHANAIAIHKPVPRRSPKSGH
jgi:hypothetical protein